MPARVPIRSRADFRDPYAIEKTRNEANTYQDRSRIGELTQVRVNVETHVEVRSTVMFQVQVQVY
jgi:hypothetical protein